MWKELTMSNEDLHAKAIDIAIGMTHGTNAVVLELARFLLGDGPKRDEFAERLRASAAALDPETNAYQRISSEMMNMFAANLTRSKEQQAQLDEDLRALMRSIRANQS